MIPLIKGHLAISKEAKKDLILKRLYGQLLRKTHFKIREQNDRLKKEIKDCKKIIGLNSFIKVKFYENIIKSNKTIDLINLS